MQKKQSYSIVLLVGLLSAILLVFLSYSGYGTVIERVVGWVSAPLTFLQKKETGVTDDINKENRKLTLQLARLQQLEKENKALRDQFETQLIRSSTLLPAVVIGKPTFIPGVTVPEELILDKGKDDGMQVDQGVIYQDNLIGKVQRVSVTRSIVMLVTNPTFTIPVKSSRSGALGLVKGQGKGEMLLDNVVLSEELKVGDLLLTSGSMNAEGVGIPPNLVVGKIVSIDKRPSALFQMARVQSLRDPALLPIVFITQ